MIHFSELRMRRMTVQLRELSIKESVEIAAIPSDFDQSSCTTFLRYAVSSTKSNVAELDLSDPAKWTVQERMMAVCHYLAPTTESGPDFAVGNGKYSDYLNIGQNDSAAFLSDPVDVGNVGGDLWFIKHLTGEMAQSIERLNGEIQGVSGRLHWILGGMAAQLYRKSDDSATEDQGDIDQMLLQKMNVFSAFSESDFMELMSLYYAAREKLNHIFVIDFSDDGIVALPREGGDASNLHPARFPSHTCITRFTQNLVGKH